MVMNVFQNTWLSCYPKPMKVICDRGPEFLGHEFLVKLLEAGIRFKPISALNPQSNGIIEWVHQVIAQILQVMIEQQKPKIQAQCDEIVQDDIAMAMHAT